MRKAATSLNRRRREVVRTLPAPVLGWNARDSIASMKEAFAVILDNWWPDGSDVVLRKGSANHLTAVPGGSNVETLAAYRPKSGSQKLFAWAGTAMYDASAAGATGAAVLSGLTNARWQCTNFGNSSGHFLLCLNGADDMRMYNGAAWTTINGASLPSITNVATANLINVFQFKQRPWYIEKNSLNLWYPAAGAFAGALVSLPLEGVFKKGGYIVAGGSWPVDAGSGMDDLMVVVSSEGEIVVYQGTNPASLSLVGVYAVGKPIGNRCVLKLGSDLLILTTDGLLPLAKIMGSGDSNKAIALTDNIQTAMTDAAKLYSSRFGWEASFYPGANMLLLNVPVGDGLQQQFVLNTVTPAWARFLPKGNCPGWPSYCFEVYNDELYFGSTGLVRKAWTGTADNGVAIESDLLPAFNQFGYGQEKQFLRVKPIIGWDSNPAEILIGMDVNYIIGTPTSSISLPTSSAGQWDSGTYDSAVWGGDVALNNDWYGAEGTGNSGALHLSAKSANAQIKLSAITYAFELTT
jgi:hypothetical protein